MSLDVIERCTRNGVVLWHHVAKQLGMSVDQARSQLDPEYRTPRQDPQRLSEPWPDELTDAEAYRSPHAKSDGMKTVILDLLDRNGALSAEALAVLTASTPASVRKRLSQLAAMGCIAHDSRWPRTYWLSQSGKTIARTNHHRPGRIGQGAGSDEDVAA